MLDEQAKAFYRTALQNTPLGGAAACGFELSASQSVRFEWVWRNMFEQPVDNDVDLCILDVGCGTGDLLEFLLDRGARIERYVGVDLMPEMIERCVERFSGFEYAEFVCGDVNTIAFGHETFDYGVAVATFCLKPLMWSQADTFLNVSYTLKSMAQSVTKAMFATVLSTWKTDVKPDELVLDPALLWQWAKVELSERVDLIHSYAPHDFGLYVQFEKSEWRRAWEARPASQ